MDITARLLVGVGCVDSAACSTVVLGGDGNEQKRKRRKLWRGRVESWHSCASPGRDKDAGEAPGRQVAWRFARLARWHSTEQLGCAGRGRRRPCPCGPAGLGGPTSPRRHVSISEFFCLIFPFCFSVILFSLENK